MPVETANRPTEVNIRQNESRSSDTELYRMSREQMQKEAPRYWAYVLGAEYQQEQTNNGRRWFQIPDSAQRAAMPLEIRGNPELREIFETSSYLTREVLRRERETMSMELSPLMNKPVSSEEVKKRKYAELGRLKKIFYSYRKGVVESSQPGIPGEPLPRVCIEATKYQVEDKAVPDKHTHSCPICSGK